MSEPEAEVYMRDASWYRKPNWSGPKKLHRESAAEPETPACNPGRVLLVMDNGVLLSDAHPSRLCRRCFPAPVVARPAPQTEGERDHE